MANTKWEEMIIGQELIKKRNLRNKTFVLKKEKSELLPQLVDEGWEKIKEYENDKYVGVKKDKDIEEQFEDRIWVMLAKMGFLEMNGSREFEISYDFHDLDKVRHMDILAVDDETILLMECKATEEVQEANFAEQIQELSGQVEGLRREAVKQYPGRKVKFIWASYNYIMNRKDLAALDKAGIIYFSNSTVDYYIELVKHIGTSARYQLLGSLFANQEIKNMDNRIPAIQGRMGGYTYYSFSIEPEKLLKIGYVLHRNEANQSMMPTYQRLIKKKRLQEVREYINEGGYFPNSIIISIDTGGKALQFDLAQPKLDNSISKIGILHIPKKYRSAYIIDGQHRLYGYSNSKYANTNSIPVVAFVDLERSEQIKMFMDINENQKAVPKTLRVTLNADMLWESPDYNEQRQALRSKIAQMLGDEPTSPLYSRIVIGENESSQTKCITVEAIQAALKKCNFFALFGKKNEIVKEGTFDCGSNQETCDLFYPFIEYCFLYVRDACTEEWEKGDTDSGMLTMNRGIQAVIRVINDVVNMLVSKKEINPKTQSVEEMFDIIRYYLSPLAEYINNLTAEQRKDLRGYFGGGADTRFWRAYQKAIADARPGFTPEGLGEFWINETKIYNDDTKEMIVEIDRRTKVLISEKLEDFYGTNWLVKGLPKTIYTKVKTIADEKIYESITNNEEGDEISPWSFVSMDDCKQIVISGKLWSTIFEFIFVRPEEQNIAGGKEAKTAWISKINTIHNKLNFDKYSVPAVEYQYVKSIYDWLTGILVL